jgi:putative hydrolases of HD superfamily
VVCGFAEQLPNLSGQVGMKVPSASAGISDPSSIPSNSPLSFILDVCGALKRLKRQGWLIRKVPMPESDSDHMHRVALTGMLYHSTASFDLDYCACPDLHPDKIDATKLLRMAVTHDLCEAIAGDITPHCQNQGSRRDFEEEAMQQIARIVGEPLGSELAALWKEYEDQTTPLAVVVKDLDKFEMLAQAFEYEQVHLNNCPAGIDPMRDTPSLSSTAIGASQPPTIAEEPLRDFFQRQQGKMKTPLFQKLDAELRLRRKAMLATKGWHVTDGEM